MKIFKEKEKVRPKQILGKNNNFTWYTDNNELLISLNGACEFSEYVEELSGFYTDNPYLKAIPDIFKGEFTINTKDLIKWLKKDFLAVFLVFSELPQVVENIIITQNKQNIVEEGKFRDLVNAKRGRINGIN